MVRVNEFRQNGSKAMLSLWEISGRLASTSFLVASVFLLAPLIAPILLPGSELAASVFSFLTPLIFTVALSSVLAPMSDYLGGLKLRNSILSVITLLQLPVMILSIRFYGSQGALYSYLGLMIVLSTLYFLLVQYIFFNSIKVVIRPEVLFFVFACSHRHSCRIIYACFLSHGLTYI